jgi:cell division transport system permease protein
MLPLLVAAMAFLAALALAGSAGAAALVRHWESGAAAALTVQVPAPADPAANAPGQNRLDAVLAMLRAAPGVADAHALTQAELAALLRPWLGAAGESVALPLPAIVAVQLAGGGPDLAALEVQLTAAAPGTLVERQGIWVQRLARLARSLRACAWLALAVVAGVAAAVVGAATRAGLLARREAIEILHGLGATDAYIADRFAARATLLAATGGGLGALAALPVVLALASLASPFVAAPGAPPAPPLAALPDELVLGLPALPAGAAAIGFLTAHATVRRWLRRLP